MERQNEHSNAGLGPDAVYGIYKRVHVADQLTYEEFIDFWECISEKEKAWFLEQFQQGEPVLTRDVFNVDSGFRAAFHGRIRPEIQTMVEDGLRDIGL
jgi:hypothetical protein